jgi:hypothetical protein
MGGLLEWCYVCGAYRHLDRSSAPRSKWIRPSGDKRNNPTAQIEGDKHLFTQRRIKP